MKIISSDNIEINASFSIESIDGIFGLVLESRGGAKGKSNERNTEYTTALDIILSRLQQYEIETIQVSIVSSMALKLWLAQERLLIIDNNSSININSYSIPELRRKLCRAQELFKSNPDSKGGNGTKRIIISTSLNENEWMMLAQGKIQENDEINSSFKFENIDSARERSVELVSVRRGQSSFRKKLLSAYGFKCAITSTKVVETLEAAHIYPYMGKATNHISNGIILRSDIHNLFDLGMINIGLDYKVNISPALECSEYYIYNNTIINLPEKYELHPSLISLKERNRLFN
ncbi:HNH endonuclease [Yersinia pseudotuberculosis]|uniref:HNH endonuclease n=1 Tax=Yersinia pseudotuberculosis TaxID=633 RepID=A0ABN5R289_YERPU|nr:HNH endonuclease [Yersinia pseudotuberculosis]AYW90040.1 HNH endonuclease [Yersinia pseudotuberculosis]